MKRAPRNRYQEKRDIEFMKTYAIAFPRDRAFEKISLSKHLPSRVTEDSNPKVRGTTNIEKRTATEEINDDPDIISERKKLKVSISTSGDEDKHDDNHEPENERNVQMNRKLEEEEENDASNENDYVQLRENDEYDKKRVNLDESGVAEEEEAEGVIDNREAEEADDDDNEEDHGEEDEEEEEKVQNDVIENESNGTAGCYDNSAEKNLFAFSKMRAWSHELTVKRGITNVDVVTQILANAVRSNWTYESIMRSLKMQTNIFIESGIPKTIAGLWKLLARNDEAISKRYYFCDKCKSMMGNNANMLIDCRCGKYKANGTTKLIPYFIQVRLAPQLRQLLQTPTIYDALQYSRTRTKRNVNNIDDMYDGVKYKEMTTARGFLSNANNFSATINTDGCSVANSSNASAWPVLLQINELPPHLRKRHILLGGIYVGSTHPHLNTFLNPTIKELQELYQIGVLWKNPVDGIERISKIVTAVCSVDTPARSEILNMTRFNGKFGCTFCLNKGKSVEGTTSRGWVYPTIEGTKLRIDNDLRTEMMAAHLSKTRINGVKGVSVMATLDEFNLVTGMAVESMHNVYLGLAKLHTMLLFDGKATEKWYCGSPSTLLAIDAKLTSIQRPSKISRSTRSLKNMKSWKANEWRNWIIYYAIVCVQEHIPERYVKHLAKLSSAIYIYNKDSISVQELEEARHLIDSYVKEFQDTFGEKNMRYNVHLLTHLPDTVQNWGPLWAHSAFPFESWNKKIIDCVTSANSRPLQIVTRQMMYTFMESLLHEKSINDYTKQSVMSTLYGGGKKGRKLGNHPHDDSFKFEGKRKSNTRAPMDWEFQALQAAGFNNVESLTSYRTVTIRGLNFESHEPGTPQTKRYCDEYVHCEFGFARIIDIVECTNQSDNVIVRGLFVTCMQSVSNVNGAQHIHRVKLISTDKRFVCVDDEPPRPVVRMATDDHFEFAVTLCNVWESD